MQSFFGLGFFVAPQRAIFFFCHRPGRQGALLIGGPTCPICAVSWRPVLYARKGAPTRNKEHRSARTTADSEKNVHPPKETLPREQTKEEKRMTRYTNALPFCSPAVARIPHGTTLLLAMSLVCCVALLDANPALCAATHATERQTGADTCESIGEAEPCYRRCGCEWCPPPGQGAGCHTVMANATIHGGPCADGRPGRRDAFWSCHRDAVAWIIAASVGLLCIVCTLVGVTCWCCRRRIASLCREAVAYCCHSEWHWMRAPTSDKVWLGDYVAAPHHVNP